MKYAGIVAVIAAVGVEAQKNCQYVKDIKPLPDPLNQLPPDKATFPCDMGSPVPLGKVPTGCAKLEVIVGKCLISLL